MNDKLGEKKPRYIDIQTDKQIDWLLDWLIYWSLDRWTDRRTNRRANIMQMPKEKYWEIIKDIEKNRISIVQTYLQTTLRVYIFDFTVFPFHSRLQVKLVPASLRCMLWRRSCADFVTFHHNFPGGLPTSLVLQEQSRSEPSMTYGGQLYFSGDKGGSEGEFNDRLRIWEGSKDPKLALTMQNVRMCSVSHKHRTK